MLLFFGQKTVHQYLKRVPQVQLPVFVSFGQILEVNIRSSEMYYMHNNNKNRTDDSVVSSEWERHEK